jgi:hypothetical protein
LVQPPDATPRFFGFGPGRARCGLCGACFALHAAHHGDQPESVHFERGHEAATKGARHCLHTAGAFSGSAARFSGFSR